MTEIVDLRLTGNERAIRVAIALLHYALLEVAQVSPPRASTYKKYEGSALARGTIRVPLDDDAILALEARIRARLLETTPAPSAATGPTTRLQRRKRS